MIRYKNKTKFSLDFSGLKLNKRKRVTYPILKRQNECTQNPHTSKPLDCDKKRPTLNDRGQLLPRRRARDENYKTPRLFVAFTHTHTHTRPRSFPAVNILSGEISALEFSTSYGKK